MKVHEYQSKEILSRHGIPVPRGRFASTPQEARDIAAGLGGRVMVKAQVHAGGRGKGGGIRLVSSPEEAERATASLLGARLVTPQTGPEGVPVRGVLVEEAIEIERELYLGMVIDGIAQGVMVMASEAGGMEIEEVADRTPEKILRATVDPFLGLRPYQGRRLANGLGVKPELVGAVASLAGALYRVFESYDCSLAEINPLAITADGRALAADAKLGFDDDALFRHPEIKEIRDPEQEDPREVLAGRHDISYVRLDGDVGCLVNGAGLAMATMDVALAAGASPANFLDVGGGADVGKVTEAVKIILSDPAVRWVLVNIFGGILRCDIVARGILEAAEGADHGVQPMVVRMRGTNAEEGRRLLSESNLDITFVNDFKEAAEAIKIAARRGAG